MWMASCRIPRSALLTEASFRFPSKSIKKRYSQFLPGIGLDSMCVMLTSLYMKFDRILYRVPDECGSSKQIVIFFGIDVTNISHFSHFFN